MGYTFFREKVCTETNFLRPRYIAGRDGGRSLKGTIVVSEGPTKGKICWGEVDGEDNYIAENQQLLYNPHTGELLPATTAELMDKFRPRRDC